MTPNQKAATKIIADIRKVKSGTFTLQDLEEAIEGHLKTTDDQFPKGLRELADSLVPRIYLHDHGSGSALVNPPKEYEYSRNEGFDAFFDEVIRALEKYLKT